MRRKSVAAESASERIVKTIRRATRKHYSAEEKIRIVLDGLRGESSIAELCRREGIAESLYYTWSKEFLEAGKRRLAGDTARAATSERFMRSSAAAESQCGVNHRRRVFTHPGSNATGTKPAAGLTMSAMHPKATYSSLRTACREGPITEAGLFEHRNWRVTMRYKRSAVLVSRCYGDLRAPWPSRCVRPPKEDAAKITRYALLRSLFGRWGWFPLNHS